MPDGSEWPCISIVTPNYNYGHFLEETIRSVLLQGYPNLEYIVIDGGSTDNSVEIIKKYEPWLTYWISEKDNGQTNAINKGIEKCNCDIFNWINSDDRLYSRSLEKVANCWHVNQPDILIGNAIGIDIGNSHLLQTWKPCKPTGALDWIRKGQLGLKISQPSTFLSYRLMKQVGFIREDLNYAFDWALYFNIWLSFPAVKISIIPDTLSTFLIHPAAKTSSMKIFRIEEMKVLQESYPRLSPTEKLFSSLYISRVRSMFLIGKVRKNSKEPLKILTWLIIRRPYFVFYRFFWGAYRREMVSFFFQKLTSMFNSKV
ncbi:MAG: glycosyltransferase [Pseudanabaena sp. CRU_2_10]|nr:glycosyltransferase [Pseudanabaena sp. CRU_2_10]